MTNRILDFSEGGTYLRVENSQLVIERKNEETRTIPIVDIAAVVLGTTWLSLTAPVLSELAAAGAVVVVCDPKSMPISLSLPMYGRSLQSQKLAIQLNASVPARKRLWREVVVQKIKNQAAALQYLHGNGADLAALAARVRSGDPSNVEAQAARKYWLRLFADPDFRRTPRGELPPNNMLDYGYGVLRAITARAICASGLNVTLGLHHHERDNSFCLADDLMEPLRPLVDVAVAEWLRAGGHAITLNRMNKQAVLKPLLGTVLFDGENRSLFDLFSKMMASLTRCLARQQEPFVLPELFVPK